MADKTIIIIGAGISGLSTGCYGQMNDYRTRIFEMHDKAGGLCTSWKRKGYTINGCIHWMMGAKPGSSHYRIWEELCAVQGREIVYFDEYARVVEPDGKTFIVYKDIDRLEQHMKELAPEDVNVIADFIRAIRKFIDFEMPLDKAPELMGPIQGMKMMIGMLPYMRTFMKWKGMSLGDFANRFQNPFLKKIIPMCFGPEEDYFPAICAVLPLAQNATNSIGYPIGASQEFSQAIERRYTDLGGTIQYGSKVRRIIVENEQAVGILLENGDEHRADYVVSAADGHSTIFDMLEGKYINAKIKGYYDNLPLFPPLVHVALGVNRSFDDLPSTPFGTNYLLEKPVDIAGKELSFLKGVRCYNFDPTLAPAGKTLIITWFPTNYDYWKSLGKEPERYKAEKEKIADTIVKLLDQRIPGLAGQVEMRDVATPRTYERYTGVWKASFEGWNISTKTFGMRMSKTLPKLRNFFMTGQWVEPGGSILFVAVSGRNTIQIICKKDRKPFSLINDMVRPITEG